MTPAAAGPARSAASALLPGARCAKHEARAATGAGLVLALCSLAMAISGVLVIWSVAAA